MDRLEQFGKTIEEKKISIGEALYMRFYQFRVIAVLGVKGAKAAEPYVIMSNIKETFHKKDGSVTK